MRRAEGMWTVVVVALLGGCAAETRTPTGPAAPPVAPNVPMMQAAGSAGVTAPAMPMPPGNTAAVAGSAAAMPPGPSAPMPPVAMPLPPGEMPAMPVVGECGLKTKFPGDEFCIKAPPAEMGFQLRIGPSNHDNPEPRYILEPGQETTETFPAVSGNDRNVYYYYRQQRMRPGSHHLLVRTNTTSELIVSSQNPISDSPPGGKVAPEDEGVGFPLAARTPLSVNVHFINTTDKPILKEAWINFWYKDASLVKESASAIFTGTPINIMPGQHVVLSSDCPITGTGRILRLFGHKHANNVRWSSYRIRGSQKDLLFEDYEHWEEPLILEYNSITTNPTPDRANKAPGGWSGKVDLQPGDIFRFECEVVNNTNRTFTGQNEAVDDEMCIQNGTVVGTTIGMGGTGFGGGTCRFMQTPVN